MAFPADDDVVVHLDAERLRDFDNLFGHLNVSMRRRRIARRMVVQQTTVRVIAVILFVFDSSHQCRGRR